MADQREAAYGEFARRVTAVVARGLRQTGQAPLGPGEAENLVAVLRALGEEGGWAARFADDRDEMSAAQVAEGVRRLTEALPLRGGEFAGVAKQVLKGCFQPAPAVCRDSYRECDAAGRCRRQEHAYDLARLSGTHCVDCPYWEMFAKVDHITWLAPQWHAGAADLNVAAEVYVPEDFRELRCWRPPAAVPRMT